VSLELVSLELVGCPWNWSTGIGADQVFGFAVDVGADSFLHQAEVKC